MISLIKMSGGIIPRGYAVFFDIEHNIVTVGPTHPDDLKDSEEGETGD